MSDICWCNKMGECGFVIFLLVLHCILVHTEALSCFSCQNIDDPLTCNTSISCSSGQVCFLEEHGGVYKMGCVSNQQCGGVAGAGIVGRSITERQSSGCHECCSTDGCNSDLCKHQKPSSCIDDETVDCAKMNSFFHVCQDIHQASLVCPKFCNLCTLVDGSWADWSVWSSCDVTCDNGSQTRSRTCTNPAPANGGLDCVGSRTETKICQRDACPVHGGWSLWTTWGSCSVTCGVGMQRRDRSCSNPYPTLYGDHCFGESRDDRICMSTACTDGGWSSWGSWGSCSDSCGGGVKSRLRTCTNPKPSLLGRYCDGSNDQVIPCNKSPCPGWKVAFTAHGVYVINTNSLRFPYIDQNYGGGYSSSSGKFTCPVAGIYYFSVTLRKKWNVDIDQVYCHLYINSNAKLATGEDPYNNDKSGYSMTMSGTFHLNKNDVVYVGNCYEANELYNSNFCAFTGFLVLPDN